ncbi:MULTISPECIES: phage holin family protein [Rhodococcus]|uniref:Phage holin family protein n=1 Tax=Rhodococcus oxybenzonivorans TaxID=1990687 RepID=A0AAE4UZY6_9NOCA|nr:MULTISPECIES: phage holin family protein [Rhodococcus]MDV7241244.1 phage holin family protein [Rhodococcus oxybenzonivorans]MDV7265722.1 phage holin family protein [Rhodococcus oxybenzonivorans]MDV7273517.1 phage holin family protein [Rhodococcus oxybenzonivorans]MDV7332745.1 phage holin family protein [Rhodococcus oxybenzonivorans]MDV7341911.1 phage holin family protein [Rhodococcus oxybenzonivorans]
MIRFLLRAVVFLGSAAIGLLAAVWLLPEVSITAAGFIGTVVLFALAQSILAPFITKLTERNAPVFLGGIGLVSTFVSLVLVNLFGAMSITGWQSWVFATLIVWLVTAVATLVLPLIFLRNRVKEPKH